MSMKAAFIFLAAAGLAACSPEPTPEMQMSNHALLDTTAGRASLFVGPGVAAAFAQGKVLKPGDRQAFFLLQVPIHQVELARGNQSRVMSFSLEEKQPFDVQLVANQPIGDRVDVTSVRPGDPWVTGIAQIWIAADGNPVGLFDLRIWVKQGPKGPYSMQDYTTGLRHDPAAPMLKFKNDPTQAPANRQ